MASGASSRFGSNKLLANLGGKPLLSHTLDKLTQLSFDGVTVVSIYDEVAAMAKAAGFSHAVPKGSGQNDTVRAGILQMADMDGCMFCVGDQPLCKKSSIERMTAAFRDNPDMIVRLFSGVIPGNPVLYPKSLFKELESLPRDTGGRWILQKYPERLLKVQAEFAFELDDVDSPESLRYMEKFLQMQACCE